MQGLGSVALLCAGVQTWPIWLGVVLFGAGIGNATSLPPLIAQREFPPPEVQRTVALIVAVSQACYAFAPATFGALVALATPGTSSSLLFAGAGIVQLLAIACFALGIRRGHPGAAAGTGRACR